MAKSKFLLLSTLVFSLGNIVAAEINTTDPYLIIGSISKEEALEEHKKYLSEHPELPNDMNAWIQGSNELPANLQFNRVIPNPNYIPTADPEIITPRNQPSAKVFKLKYPPLNQGSMGTCATFTTLGAIQSTYNGLSISPSCTLQMMYTATNKNHWNGSWPDQSMAEIRNHGYITSTAGATGLCNYSYPVYQPYSPPSNEPQKKLATPLNNYKAQATSAANIYYRMYGNINNPQAALDMIRNEINGRASNGVIFNNVPGQTSGTSWIDGSLTTISFWVSQSDNCLSYKTVNINGKNKSIKVWNSCKFEKTSGHATYVYGYDNNICINGNECGVLFLRNSWGNTSDNGNFLMTYKYFLENYMAHNNVAFALFGSVFADPNLDYIRQ
jgi:hypothetical protein